MLCAQTKKEFWWLFLLIMLAFFISFVHVFPFLLFDASKVRLCAIWPVFKCSDIYWRWHYWYCDSARQNHRENRRRTWPVARYPRTACPCPGRTTRSWRQIVATLAKEHASLSSHERGSSTVFTKSLLAVSAAQLPVLKSFLLVVFTPVFCDLITPPTAHSWLHLRAYLTETHCSTWLCFNVFHFGFRITATDRFHKLEQLNLWIWCIELDFHEHFHLQNHQLGVTTL